MICSVLIGHLRYGKRIQQGYGKTRKTCKWEKLAKELFLDNKAIIFKAFEFYYLRRFLREQFPVMMYGEDQKPF